LRFFALRMTIRAQNSRCGLYRVEFLHSQGHNPNGFRPLLCQLPPAADRRSHRRGALAGSAVWHGVKFRDRIEVVDPSLLRANEYLPPWHQFISFAEPLQGARCRLLEQKRYHSDSLGSDAPSDHPSDLQRTRRLLEATRFCCAATCGSRWRYRLGEHYDSCFRIEGKIKNFDRKNQSAANSIGSYLLLGTVAYMEQGP